MVGQTAVMNLHGGGDGVGQRRPTTATADDDNTRSDAERAHPRRDEVGRARVVEPAGEREPGGAVRRREGVELPTTAVATTDNEANVEADGRGGSDGGGNDRW